jgi:hypothetical protein
MKETKQIKNIIKVIPLHAVKVYRGIRGIAPLILNLGARWS